MIEMLLFTQNNILCEILKCVFFHTLLALSTMELMNNGTEYYIKTEEKLLSNVRF